MEFYQGKPPYAGESDDGAIFGPGTETYSDPEGGGQIYTQVTHAASLLFYLTGSARVEVAAFQSATYDTKVDVWDADHFPDQARRRRHRCQHRVTLAAGRRRVSRNTASSVARAMPPR